MYGMVPKICKRCQKADTINGKHTYCNECQAEEQNRPICKKDGCKNRAKEEIKYCGKHHLLHWKEQIEETGKRVCANYTRGCKEILEQDYPTKRCRACLDKDIEADKKRTEEKKKALPSVEESTGFKLCNTCFKYSPPDHYIGEKDNTPVVRCKTCRANGKKADQNRNKEHRNQLERIAANRPGRKATKQEWAKYNQDKVLLKSQKSKAKKMLEDPEGTLQKGREQAAKHRQENPEKMVKFNEERRLSKEASFRVYKNSASSKKLDFEFNKEQFMEMIARPCHYCNGFPKAGSKLEEKGFNGIDRLDCKKGYLLSNCVPCCTMCNHLKASLSEEVFLKRVAHICHKEEQEQLKEEKQEDKNLYPEAFADSVGLSLQGIQNRANKLKVPYDLTPEYFEELHREGCYLCGKQNRTQSVVGKEKVMHRNGTDRVENAKGYIVGNVRPCCGECNYMKKDYSLDIFLQKLKQIYDVRKLETADYPVEIEETDYDMMLLCGGNPTIQTNNKSIQKHLDKFTKEEREQRKEEKKQERMAKLAEEWPELVPKK